jgi:maltooligosyltrehalose trehalohydrolase
MTPQFIDNDQCVFRVWAPEKKVVVLHLLRSHSSADGEQIPMQKEKEGYFSVKVGGIRAGQRYFYRVGSNLPDHSDLSKPRDLPDPVSSFQPEGVFGPSSVVDHRAWTWQDAGWRGLPLHDLVFYELHVGTFTPEGTFEAVIPRLDDLAALGINAIELMPVSQYSGNRNWGYDGVFLFAVQHSYGGPEGLKKLVDACHRHGIAVFLDVVYNHVGTEGNILAEFGPYFSDKYQTPWGKALNLDGAWCDGVRDFVLGNIRHWAETYHIDGLRLDAVHEMYDRNAITIWDQMQSYSREWQQRSGRTFYLIAESDTNDPRTVRTIDAGGKGFDAQWMDDFHHALYVLLDKNARASYYDFGSLQQFARAYTEGFVHRGEWVAFRKRRHGANSAGMPGERFVVFNQNHDLPGNRPDGARLSQLVSPDKLKLAAAAMILSPYLPMLFMGEEYGEENPFYFFSDYKGQEMAAGLKEGRKKEFAGFGWKETPRDPQEEETFLLSKLRWEVRGEIGHKELLEWHAALLRLRKTHPLFRGLSRARIRADLFAPSSMAVTRHSDNGTLELLCLFNFSGVAAQYGQPHNAWAETIEYGREEWTRLLDSSLTDQRASTAPNSQDWMLPPWSASVWEKYCPSAR